MTTNNTRKEKDGQYFYGCHRNYYGVWVWDHVWENGASGRFVADFNTREEARAFVWRMNGWGTTQNRTRKLSLTSNTFQYEHYHYYSHQ